MKLLIMKKGLPCVWLEKLNILISSCLLGERVRYDGKVKKYDLSKLDSYNLISVCPESDGGLATPRPPSEIQNTKVINSLGVDVSKEFEKGAHVALNLVQRYKIKVAILKSKSPSCSNRLIYDGSFSGILKEGKGWTVTLLEKHKVKVFDENDIEDAVKYISQLQVV